MHVTATGTYIGNGDTKLDFYRSGNAQENDYWIYDNVSLVALESYTQPIGYIGTQTVNLQPDSFSYKANDGAADSNIGVVKINVIPVDDAPTAQTGGTSTGTEDTTKLIHFWGTPADGNSYGTMSHYIEKYPYSQKTSPIDTFFFDTFLIPVLSWNLFFFLFFIFVIFL